MMGWEHRTEGCLQYRTLGRTGLRVFEIGYGAWGIGKSGWVGADDDESLRALQWAIDLGLTFIDTALGYGDGHSERLVGQVVRAHSQPIYVATKIPPKNGQWPARAGVPASEAFPRDHVIACTERSLRNLGLDAIDVQQFHVWSDEWVGHGDCSRRSRASKSRARSASSASLSTTTNPTTRSRCSTRAWWTRCR